MPHFKSQRQKVKFLPSGIGISGISRSNTITVAKYVVLVQGVGCYCCRYSLIHVRKQPCGNYPFSRLVRYFPIWASGFFSGLRLPSLPSALDFEQPKRTSQHCLQQQSETSEAHKVNCHLFFLLLFLITVAAHHNRNLKKISFCCFWEKTCLNLANLDIFFMKRISWTLVSCQVFCFFCWDW